MTVFTFYCVSCDPSTYRVPTLERVQAKSLNQAIAQFASAHQLSLDEEPEVDRQSWYVWFSKPDGTNVQYNVS